MAINENDLKHFTGADQWHRFNALMPSALLTDGALYVAKEGGAFWLMDIIASVQHKPKINAEYFQVWRLKVNEDKSALVTCDDGNENILYTQEVPHTDFNLSEIKLYAIYPSDEPKGDLIIMLPSEY